VPGTSACKRRSEEISATADHIERADLRAARATWPALVQPFRERSQPAREPAPFRTPGKPASGIPPSQTPALVRVDSSLNSAPSRRRGVRASLAAQA
jgi:hypothetical protein